MYWGINSPPKTWQETTSGLVLDVPPDIEFDDEISNSTLAWYLTAKSEGLKIVFYPRYNSLDVSGQLSGLPIDGRVAGSSYESYVDTGILRVQFL
jgi:hypothetical protein